MRGFIDQAQFMTVLMHISIPPILFSLSLLLINHPLQAQPLFDAHLHYNRAHAQQFTPEQVIQKLQNNDIQQALVTSSPPQLAMDLHHQAPERVLPMLGAYRTWQDKMNWYRDEQLPARIEAQLKHGGWRAIGELHLFAADRHSPVFKRMIELAGEYRLPLMLHADPAVIDTLYEWSPHQVVIWAHAGTFPYPDLIADYLQRYPQLYVDVSVRDRRIAPGGMLADDWYELFNRYPGRFLIGVDTFSPGRWQHFDGAVDDIKAWLGQLPEALRHHLAYGNATRLFGRDTDSPDPAPRPSSGLDQ